MRGNPREIGVLHEDDHGELTEDKLFNKTGERRLFLYARAGIPQAWIVDLAAES